MDYYHHITELIGNTPIIKINHFDLPKDVNIFAKLESFNPGGSIKDRIGHWIIKKAEERGDLKKGYTIIEATAGNTGIGIALAALNKGYRLILVVPGKFSIEKQVIMKALGAEIVSTPTKDGLEGAFKEVEKLQNKIENVFIVDQFNNPDNPEVHFLYTAKEIDNQLEGNIDVFIAGAGSGGTFTGVMKYFHDKNKTVKGVLADPVGSIIGGGKDDKYEIEGIGNDFIPATLDMNFVDDVVKVTDEDAFQMVKELALREGLLVGSSSGAAFYAALIQAKKMTSGNVVVVFPDSSERYISKNIYK
ncbi:cystathionine beta-synthase (acetylserine-dependent) [Natronincola peptidivorans]|uniref:Cysteine synthase n=1 Tax=Natronincola peptidivorans TaxID=426128 RepID=A0A1I0BFS2_9FIRM|nr:cysteine synthase family protein [Natronincola peptidivorans]SET05795.1 cystathionine beta-synthase (acetylserine-dependent) [Natronincola peptidivorans]